MLGDDSSNQCLDQICTLLQESRFPVCKQNSTGPSSVSFHTLTSVWYIATSLTLLFLPFTLLRFQKCRWRHYVSGALHNFVCYPLCFQQYS